jgi:hypothetical protein
MPKQTKPSIVFAHGLWADGSCFSKLIPSLQADGHEVICSQHGLDSLKGEPYQLDESANAPCTRTMVGLAGCAVAAAPVSKTPTNVQIATKVFISNSLF